VRELRVPPSLDICWSVFWVQRTSFGGLAVELHRTADFKISYTCGIPNPSANPTVDFSLASKN
jgi:hypothetical protein